MPRLRLFNTIFYLREINAKLMLNLKNSILRNSKKYYTQKFQKTVEHKCFEKIATDFRDRI